MPQRQGTGGERGRATRVVNTSFLCHHYRDIGSNAMCMSNSWTRSSVRQLRLALTDPVILVFHGLPSQGRGNEPFHGENDKRKPRTVSECNNHPECHKPHAVVAEITQTCRPCIRPLSPEVTTAICPRVPPTPCAPVKC